MLIIVLARYDFLYVYIFLYLFGIISSILLKGITSHLIHTLASTKCFGTIQLPMFCTELFFDLHRIKFSYFLHAFNHLRATAWFLFTV